MFKKKVLRFFWNDALKEHYIWARDLLFGKTIEALKKNQRESSMTSHPDTVIIN